MEATVTIKTTPAELDIVRDALSVAIEAWMAIGEGQSQPAPVRREAKAKAVEAGNVLRKLR